MSDREAEVTEPPAFEYVDKFEIKGRGTAYSGPAPFDLDRGSVGKVVMVDGKERTIAGFERFNRNPRKGEPTSLLFSDEPRSSSVTPL